MYYFLQDDPRPFCSKSLSVQVMLSQEDEISDEDYMEDAAVEEEVLRMESANVGDDVMVRLLKPFVDLYGRGLTMSGYTYKLRVQIVNDFLARGAKYVSKEELVIKEVSPESLRDHLKDSMELETTLLFLSRKKKEYVQVHE